MNTIEIINGGLLTTIQDAGRQGYQKYGVPVSGAMDLYAMQLANIILGNKRNEAALECTLKGAVLRFNCSTVISITGADMNPRLNGICIEGYKQIEVQKDSILELSYAKTGYRSYVAIKGGFDIPCIMGSKSTYLRGNIGGYNGKKLEAGDVVPIHEKKLNKAVNKKVPEEYIPKYSNNAILRVIMGPEDEYFTEAAVEKFLNFQYTISNNADRMGYRLEGEKIEHKYEADIVSNGINMGAIQIPGDGKPIIMMSDRQTTGGYTKLANVISVDIPKLAQLKPGDIVCFKKIDIKTAQLLLGEQEKVLNNLESYFKASKRYNISLRDKIYEVEVHEI